MPLPSKKEKKKVVKVNYFSEGFVAGQRKLCQAILEMTLENISDYQWLLSHLKEVSEGREVLDNTAIGFTPYNKK